MTQGSGDGHTKNINGINAVQVGFLGGVPLLGDGQSLPSGWKGKLAALTSAMRPPA